MPTSRYNNILILSVLFITDHTKTYKLSSSLTYHKRYQKAKFYIYNNSNYFLGERKEKIIKIINYVDLKTILIYNFL